MAAVEDFETLLRYRKEYFTICEMFAIPIEDRDKEGVGEQVTERIRTYLTSYIMRKSIVEKSSKAAFISPDTEDAKPQG